MGEIVKVTADPEVQDRAEEIHKEVLARTYITAHNMFELGKLFKTIRDEKLFKFLGADTFGEYIGYPEISFGRSTIYSFIQVYEKYVLKLDIPAETLSKIGHRKLQIINPVVSCEPAFWLDNAEVLSESDLINAVRGFQNKPEMIPKPREEENVYPFSFEDYLAFIKAHPCIICGEKEVDNAHFPRSRGAGGRDTDCIPLCRKCHRESHSDLYDWLWLNKNKVFLYFYDTILEAFDIIRRNE